MKPLQLVMQAFGPFAGRQDIDFRRLGDRTFFLIHGPTGSGKTSILDGMCFALFGDSSGGERESRQMRSHHADDGTPTEVRLEFALGPQRFRVVRAPEQMRKAKRGVGLVRQAASAELLRLQAGEADVPLAAGWERVTQQVVQLLGFESRQFRQVILLPQGRFFDFLKASSQERERILQVLFGTELYKRIEEALKRAADEIATRAAQARTRRQALLEQAGVDSEAALEARLLSQRASLDAARQAEAAATQAAAVADTALAMARATAACFAEEDAARQALAALEREQPQWLQRRAALDAARQAATLRPAEAALADARQALQRELRLQNERTAAWTQATAAVDATRADLQRQEALAPRREQLLAQVARLDALADSVARLDAARQAADTATQALARAQAQATAAREAQAGAAAALERLQDEVQQLTAAAAGLEAARLRLQALQQAQQRAQELAVQRRQLAQAQQGLQARQQALAVAQGGLERARAAREATLQAWIAGQSARIAHSLHEGAPCPVCGALEHPQPASSRQAAVGDDGLQLAEQALRDAEQAHGAAQAAEATARTGAAVLRAAVERLEADGPEHPAVADLDAAGTQVARAEAAARALASQQVRMAAARQQAEQMQATLAARDAALRASEAEAARAGAVFAQLQQLVPPDLATPDALQSARDAVTRERDALAQALQAAHSAAASAAQQHARCQALAEESAAACERAQALASRQQEAFDAQRLHAGFADEAAWRLARLDDAAMQAAQAALDRHVQQLAAARERLQRASARTQGSDRPDVAQHEDAARQRRQAALEASLRVGELQGRLAHDEGFAATLARIAHDFRQLEERHALLRAVADMAGGQNPQRMSFQRYVLATLLEEVLAATSQRLGVMSRGRYELRRRAEAADARSAGGLDLEAFDHYTGTVRPVATLSGGESFLASLALALGLSDVVQAHAGGTRLDAIFVDEGFGTLDPEALDFAVRTLKDLQQAGRMVGIISHVAELKEWMDARLELRPTQSGSRAEFVV